MYMYNMNIYVLCCNPFGAMAYNSCTYYFWPGNGGPIPVRLLTIDNFIATVQEALMNTWDLERGRVGKVQALKEKLDALKVEIEHAERGYDLNKAAELTYAVMPKLQVRCTQPDSRCVPVSIGVCTLWFD